MALVFKLSDPSLGAGVLTSGSTWRRWLDWPCCISQSTVNYPTIWVQCPLTNGLNRYMDTLESFMLNYWYYTVLYVLYVCVAGMHRIQTISWGSKPILVVVGIRKSCSRIWLWMLKYNFYLLYFYLDLKALLQAVRSKNYESKQMPDFVTFIVNFLWKLFYQQLCIIHK